MSAPVLTLFNNKSGVGKTSLIYHLAWMFASLGKRVVVVDLDPQATLKAAFLDEEKIAALWNGHEAGSTIFQCVSRVAETGEIVKPQLRSISANLFMLPGDVALAGFEESLSSAWQESSRGTDRETPMRLLSAFWQVMQLAADEVQSDIVLVESGSNLGAINRSVLIATDCVVIPLGADLFSLKGLEILGPTLGRWRGAWSRRLDQWNDSAEHEGYSGFRLPQGRMQPVG